MIKTVKKDTCTSYVAVHETQVFLFTTTVFLLLCGVNESEDVFKCKVILFQGSRNLCFRFISSEPNFNRVINPILID